MSGQKAVPLSNFLKVSFFIMRGFETLLDIAISYVEAAVDDCTDDLLTQARTLFTRFIQGNLGNNICREQIVNLIQCEDPVLRIEEIVRVSCQAVPLCSFSIWSTHGRRPSRTWSSAEDCRLLAALFRFGTDSWHAVAAFVGNGRDRSQCSQRWHRGLDPRISRRPWTTEEDQQFDELVQEYGTRNWSKISAIMGNRSDVQCRYRYQTKQNLAAAESSPAGVKCAASATQISMQPMVGKLKESRSEPAIRFSGDGIKLAPLVLRETPQVQMPPPLLPRPGQSLGSSPQIKAASVRWGVCGADAKSLDTFLDNFGVNACPVASRC
jgi:hypothetical protein